MISSGGSVGGRAGAARGVHLGEGLAQGGGLLRGRLVDEPDQGGCAGGPAAGSVERLAHQVGDQLVLARGRLVAVGAAVAHPEDDPLLRQPVQDRHHGGVGQVTFDRECLVDLAYRDRLRGGPDVFHDLAFEVSRNRHGRESTSMPLRRTRPGSVVGLVVSITG